jgi:protein CpxP
MWLERVNFYDEDIKSQELTTQATMKTKLMPLLAGLITISAVATPMLVKAQDEAPIRPPQTTQQHHQGKRSQLNLSDAQKQQLRQIEQDTRTQMQAVLTAEQQEKLKTLIQQNRQGNHQKHQDVWSQLNLSDAQKTKIQEIRQAQKTQMDAVFTAEQKQQMQQMRQQWQQRHQQQGNQ